MVSFCVRGVLSPSIALYCGVGGCPAISVYRKSQAVGTAPVHLKHHKKVYQGIPFWAFSVCAKGKIQARKNGLRSMGNGKQEGSISVGGDLSGRKPSTP